MKQIAMIRDGVVENIAAWDGVSPWSPAGYDLVDVTGTTVAIGDLYADGQFTTAPTEAQ